MKKIALVHDFLLERGGAEKVLDAVYELYPEKIYTLMKKGNWGYKEIETSYLNKKIFQKFHRHLLPFYPKAIESFDLSDYQLILSSSYAFAKNILTHTDQLHLCYCHSPMRSIYDLYFEHLEYLTGLKKLAFKQISHNLRNWDLASCNRVDVFIANSKFVARRIQKTYGKMVDYVIYPPVDVEKFSQEKRRKGDYYIFIGRLVPYKGVELLVDTFNLLPEKKLVIVGDGPLKESLKQRANLNIEILGYQEEKSCIKLLQEAKGFIFMGIEDFGIAIVEALAAGTPVIAYKAGGALEIVENENLGLFVDQRGIGSLVHALNQFEKKEFCSQELQDSVKRFSLGRFKLEYKRAVEREWEKFSSR
jgi:glycosyltransferase involved in cell wall biosynthesis